ncbi:hypothetical protein Aduo_009984 [Ancylostoma duodenale]
MLKQGKQPSLFWGVFRIVVSSLVAALVAILFIVVYVALSELHRDLAVDVHAVLKVSNELFIEDLVESALWMLDGTVACICLFLILEDAFMLYELNCELHRLNSEAYLSLREALDVDNRYIKDAIILEAAEAQEAMAEMKSAIQCKEESNTPKLANVLFFTFLAMSGFKRA